ncbi:hypothetical protein [Roseibium salinum]|uniref:Uncharacterized protein n=1 Tax=Roseibium salinum TaxID=1604349 RepID=A0ABT3R209_9HYPH|nr:hypothetical protein [Roseibium sp. DSM 29163]MCX2723125.1 hypothetical protein [Roseibium sp. DSM 29163]
MFYRGARLASGLTAAVSLFALQLSPALAFEPSGNDVADAFLTILDSDQGTVESYGGVEESGGEVTIRDLLITNENEDNAKATIGTTVLTEGEILDDGRLKLGSLGLQDLELTSDDGGMSLNNLKVTELLLPSAEEVAANKSPVGPGYRSLEINTVQIRDEDGKVADVDKIMSSIDSMDGDLPTSGSFSISGAKIDVKQIESEEAKALTDLGYETLSMNITGSGKWDPETATLVIPELKIDAQEAASLSLSLSLGGVTREVIAKLGDNPEEPEEAMALLQNVAIENAKIRLDDASLTGRILDQEAEKAGVAKSDYVSGLTSTLPMMLSMLQNKDLETQVAEAVTQYLNSPGSLQITAAPGAPVPMAQIMGTAMLAPQMIPQILSVSVTANQ